MNDNSMKMARPVLLFGLIFLIGCSASNHPMTQMIRVQRDIMQDLADVLHRVDDVADLEAATHEIEEMSQEMQRRMTRVTQSMGKSHMPKSRAQAKRLQSAMQREMNKLQPVMKRLQSEMTRLGKLDWSTPLLEAARKCKFEHSSKSS